jgi:hypothetical protein
MRGSFALPTAPAIRIFEHGVEPQKAKSPFVARRGWAAVNNGDKNEICSLIQSLVPLKRAEALINPRDMRLVCILNDLYSGNSCVRLHHIVLGGRNKGHGKVMIKFLRRLCQKRIPLTEQTRFNSHRDIFRPL